MHRDPVYSHRAVLVFKVLLVVSTLLGASAVGLHVSDTSTGSLAPKPVKQPDAVVAVPAPLPVAGFSREHEGSISVSPFTSVNLLNGNAITMLPMVALDWAGRGPGVSFGLYHNSADGVWRAEMSTRVKLIDPDSVEVTRADGRVIQFTNVAANWVPEPGYHMELAAVYDRDPHPVGWQLKFTDQTQMEFNAEGWMTQVIDSAGNAVTINRDAEGDIQNVIDAVGRRLDFHYDAQDRLYLLKEGFSVEDIVGYREWELAYDGQGRLASLSDPTDKSVSVTGYDANNRITSIANELGDTFNYEYDNEGRLVAAFDPAPLDQQVQRFQYGRSTAVDVGPQLPETIRAMRSGSNVGSQSVYIDRRGAQWTADYSPSGVIQSVSDPYNATRRYQFDADYNLTRMSDASGNSWNYQYDHRGNLLSVTDPVGTQPDVV